MKNKNKAKKIIVIKIMLIVLAVFLIVGGYKVYCILSEYYKAAKEYEEIREIAITETRTEDEEIDLTIDFKKLSEINSDIVAWIRFEEPLVINYPIVQGEDNEKYLVTTFEGEENGAGCIYMDTNNAADFSDRNTFIYGHYRKNGHMFGALGKYKDENYCKNHPYFDIYTPDGMKTKYQIFAVTVVDASSDSYRRVYVSDEEFGNYLDMVKELSLYNTGVEVTKASQVVSLSTCTNVRVEERLLIHAVQIEQENVEQKEDKK